MGGNNAMITSIVYLLFSFSYAVKLGSEASGL